MATVHPYKGYLNTEFHIYAKGTENVAYEVRDINNPSSDTIVRGSVSPNIPHTINVNIPGKYKVDFSDGTYSIIVVENGYKYGGSAYKGSFIFDETPWCFVIMNDRTYFYNRNTKESYVEAISPDKISFISNEYIMFENIDQDERTIYSLNDQIPILNISRIVFYNCDILIWEETTNEGRLTLHIYSLTDRIIKKTICVSEFIIDPIDNSIIYISENILFKQKLLLPLNDRQELQVYGEFATLVYPNIAISIEKDYTNSDICIIDTRFNRVISRINVDYPIASINSKTFIDVSERIKKLKTLDLTQIGCDEAYIETTYLSYNFYPTKWDVYYTTKQHLYENGKYKTKNIVKAVLSKDEFVFENEVTQNSVVIRNGSIFFSNYNESVIFGEKFDSCYTKGAQIYRHGKNIIRLFKEQAFILNDATGWESMNKGALSFDYFESFGIISNKIDNSHFDLCNHSYKGTAKVCFFPTKHLVISDSIILPNGKVLPNLNAATSDSGKLGIAFDLGKIYLLYFCNDKVIRERILSELYDNSEYHSVLLSIDGNQIMYRNSGQTLILDLTTNQVDNYDNLSYIKDINGIRPLFKRRPGALQPRLVNPVTGQIVPHERMAKYQFVSPDGLIYADTEINKYIETWNLITNRKLSHLELHNFYDQFSYQTSLHTKKSKS